MNSKTLKFLAGIILIGIFTIVLYLIGSFIESSFNFLIWNKILKSVLAIVWFIFFVLAIYSTAKYMKEEDISAELVREFILSDSVIEERYIAFLKNKTRTKLEKQQKQYIRKEANKLIIKFISMIMAFITIVLFLIASSRERTFNIMIWNDVIFYIFMWFFSLLFTIIFVVSSVKKSKWEIENSNEF